MAVSNTEVKPITFLKYLLSKYLKILSTFFSIFINTFLGKKKPTGKILGLTQVSFSYFN